MRCPYCKEEDSRVINSRSVDDGNSIRRRRECPSCGRRFNTYEAVERLPLMVIKNDGRREAFDHDKLLRGLVRSCDKRDISMERIVELAGNLENELRNTMEREITSKFIGESVMQKLRTFDEVAYIRFASVYRKFADLNCFRDELNDLINDKVNADEKSPVAEKES
jgi:transcriptional repressor NrdR